MATFSAPNDLVSDAVAPARGLPARRVVVREIHDRTEWNDLVVTLPAAALEQGYEWGELRRSAGWIVHRRAVFDAHRPIAAVSLLVRAVPGLGVSLIEAPRGPLLDLDDEAAWSGVMTAVRGVADATKAVVLRASPGRPEAQPGLRDALVRHDFVPLAEDWTTWNPPRITLTSSLEGSEESIFRGIKRRKREYLAAASRAGVTVTPARSARELHAFYPLIVAMGREKGYPVRSLSYFVALWQEYVERGAGVLLLARRGADVLGGIIGARLGPCAVLLYASVLRSPDVASIHPGPPLYWEFIRWAKAAGAEVLDWGGSGTTYPPRDENAGYGVYRFKRDFGASLHYLTGYYDLVFRPTWYRAFRLAERRLLPLAWRVLAQASLPLRVLRRRADQ